LIRGVRVLAGRTDIARRVPTQDARGRPNLAQAAIQVRRVGACDAPRKRVVFASRAHNAGATRRTPPASDARTIEAVPGQAGAVRALRALGLDPTVAIRGALARDTRAVVHAFPTKVAEAGGVRRRLHGRDRVGHTRLDGAFPRAIIIERTFLAVIRLRPVSGVKKSAQTPAIRVRFGHGIATCVGWTGEVAVVVAALPRVARRAEPAPDSVLTVVLLEITRFAYAFAHILGIQSRDRKSGTDTGPNIVRTRQRVFPVWAYEAGVHLHARAVVVALTSLPGKNVSLVKTKQKSEEIKQTHLTNSEIRATHRCIPVVTGIT
jgi:hypothetical protein